MTGEDPGRERRYYITSQIDISTHTPYRGMVGFLEGATVQMIPLSHGWIVFEVAPIHFQMENTWHSHHIHQTM